jgi:hypothetical protein
MYRALAAALGLVLERGRRGRFLPNPRLQRQKAGL